VPRRSHVCSKPGCPQLTPCPEHGRPRNASWSEGRDRKAQGRFRAAVLQRAQGWCERCGAAATVAHHVKPGYEPEAGLALCDACHRRLDNNARSAA
jgi:hypothetical protein